MKILTRFPLLITTGAVVLSLCACSPEPRPDDVKHTTTVTTTTTTGPTTDTTYAHPVDDVTLANRVTSTLSNTPGVDSNLITVQADDGVVTLSGNVPTAAMVSTAVATTQNVAGVRSVHSNLTVTNPPQ